MGSFLKILAFLNCQRLAESSIKTMDFMENFTLKNKKTSERLLFTSIAAVNVRECIFVQSRGEEGGAIYAQAKTFHCIYTKFVCCRSEACGAIYAKATSSFIKSCCFRSCTAEYRFHTFLLFCSNSSTFNESSTTKVLKRDTQYTNGMYNGECRMNYINCSRVHIRLYGAFASFKNTSKIASINYGCCFNTTSRSIVHSLAFKYSKPSLYMNYVDYISNTFLSYPFTGYATEKKTIIYVIRDSNFINTTRYSLETSEVTVVKCTLVNCYIEGNATDIFSNQTEMNNVLPEPTHIFNSTIFKGNCENVKTIYKTIPPKHEIPLALEVVCSITIVLIICISTIVYFYMNKKDKDRYHRWIIENTLRNEMLFTD